MCLPILYVLLIALSLSMDAFSVCLSVGACRGGNYFASAIRMGSVFGFFQFAMPILGYFSGCCVLRKFSPYDQWIAALILIFVGVKMIIDSRKDRKCNAKDPTSGITLLMLAIATSIDALSVGIGMAVTNVSIIFLSSVAGIITSGMCLLGVYFGRILGFLLGPSACMLGGLVICAIGLKMLFR